ncbi:hypothetical protein OA087_00445 [bacterium]|nr:hypothetical protein [bacterium]
MITDNKNLLKEQGNQLQIADDYLNKLEETNVLQDEILREYQLELLALQKKHIPAEMCSSGKLIENIGEVTTLIGNME